MEDLLKLWILLIISGFIIHQIQNKIDSEESIKKIIGYLVVSGLCVLIAVYILVKMLT